MSLDLSLDLTIDSDGSCFDLPCHRADPEMFFSDIPATLESAKLVCAPCPLKAECLAGALERREPHGVWGGEIFADGVVIARKRPRGRPRKHPLQQSNSAQSNPARSNPAQSNPAQSNPAQSNTAQSDTPRRDERAA